MRRDVVYSQLLQFIPEFNSERITKVVLYLRKLLLNFAVFFTHMVTRTLSLSHSLCLSLSVLATSFQMNLG